MNEQIERLRASYERVGHVELKASTSCFIRADGDRMTFDELCALTELQVEANNVLPALLSALDEAVEALRPFARMAGNPATDNSAYARAREFVAKMGRE